METAGDGRDWRDVFISHRVLKIDSTVHRARAKDHRNSQREDAPASTFLSGFQTSELCETAFYLLL